MLSHRLRIIACDRIKSVEKSCCQQFDGSRLINNKFTKSTLRGISRHAFISCEREDLGQNGLIIFDGRGSQVRPKAMSVSISTFGSSCTITVGSSDTFSNDAATDISAQVNKLINEVPAGDSTVINLDPGTYGVGTQINLSSNTSVVGDDATLEYLPGIESLTNWGMLGNGDGAYVASSISVEGVTFIISNAHIFGTWFTNARDIDVQNNTYIGGTDGNAFVSVLDAVASNNVAIGQDNAAYDNWNGDVNTVVENNSGYVSGGWNVLMNSSIAYINYPGAGAAYGIAAGNAVNDGVIDNVFSTDCPGALSVEATALLDHGYTTETDITQQGNVTQGLGILNSGEVIGNSPQSNAVIQDDSFVGIVYNTTQGEGVIEYVGQNVPGYTTSNTQMNGNLILGFKTENSVPPLINHGYNVSSVNNASIGQSNHYGISTGGDGTLTTSAGNITNVGTYISGSGVTSTSDITAPPELNVSVDTVTSVADLSIDDATVSSTVGVTLRTTFGTLSLAGAAPDAQYTTILGESAIILAGSLTQVNGELAGLSYTSNAAGWDDAIEIDVSDTAGFNSTRYIPVNVGNPESGNDQVTTITPGEVLPELFYTTITPPASLSSDTVIGSSGSNLINMGSTVSIVFLQAGVDTVIGGSGAAYIATGSGQADINLTSGGDVSISGGSGPMTINAAVGDNVIDSGDSNALVQGGSGSNTVAGGLGNLTVQGGAGSMYIATLPQDGGNLRANLGFGNTTLFALSGNDYIATTISTHNFVDLGIGNDFVASGGADIILTGAGDDTINASSGGSDSIAGGSGSLYFVAGTGNSFVDPASQTTIFAGSGNLTVGRSGATDLVQINQVTGTSRVITVDHTGTDISLLGYGDDPIVAQTLTGNFLSVSLSDGTLLKLYDSQSLYAVVVSNTLSLLPWQDLQNPDVINIDNLLANTLASAELDTPSLEEAVSEAPSGKTAVLYADLPSSAVLINNGTLVLDPTHLTLENPLTGSGVIKIDTGSGLAVEGSVASTQTIAFTGTDGSLVIGNVGQFLGTISGFMGYNTIDLSAVPFSEEGFATLTSGNALEVISNGGTAAIQLDPDQSYAGNVFDVSNDGLGGTSITDATNFMVPSGQTELFVDAPVSENIVGNGSNDFTATFGSASNVSFNSGGGSGTVVVGGAGDFVDVTGTIWSIVGNAGGSSTVNTSATDGTEVQVYGQGSAKNNAIGADTTPSNVVGLAGNASVFSDGANDLIETFSGNDAITVCNSANVLVNGGADTVYAAAGSTAVKAFFNLSGGKLLFINNSTTSATVSGDVPGASGGNVTAFGGAGGGLYVGGSAGNNSLIGGAGTVHLVAAGTNNLLSVSGYGGTYNTENVLIGGAGGATMVAANTTGFNEFHGGSGTDSIVSFGSGAQTYYVGAAGEEVLTGSTQAGAVNTYIFDQDSTDFGADVITNFRIGTDHIVINLNDSMSGVSISSFGQLGGADPGTVIFLSNSTTIDLYGVSEAALQAAKVRGGLYI